MRSRREGRSADHALTSFFRSHVCGGGGRRRRWWPTSDADTLLPSCGDGECLLPWMCLRFTKKINLLKKYDPTILLRKKYKFEINGY